MCSSDGHTLSVSFNTRTQVSIVGFKRSGMTVKLHAFDSDLGGRNFDELIFEHFCDEIKEKFKIDIRSNKKASFKLRTACERVSLLRMHISHYMHSHA